ncbi:CRISPR-associated helicase Cas3' [Streptococcus sinensis]|uniref:CRISPR-associated helicase Cas3' n=1 Tax=Streptococcus sinensis TaxID=176090 RepID=UPI001CEDCEE7|nr:CRISPR-associated helicase Cas3' [Streptococcus sinensis]MCD1276616.1 CRISPR-associated helicase/endonuclease Cas3 [Streptococcus sinensis]
MIKAHYNRDTNEMQSLKIHLTNVAESGRKEAESLGQGDVLFLLGLYHDLGKANKAFQDKLEMHPNKHVDHSSAGAIYLFQNIQACLKKSSVPLADRVLFQEISAYVISAHHGMYDIPLQDEGVQAEQFAFNKLRHRMIECMKNDSYQEDILPFAQELEDKLNDYGYKDLNDLIEKAFANYQQAWSKLSWSDESEKEYYSGCFIRMYLSFLKNADILDTINAYGLLIEPLKDEEKQKLNESYLEAIERKYRSFSHPTTRLNEIRSQIGERVKSRGEKDSTGIYRLDLPTGAGKTNLSMRYAFHQLVDQNKSRFFYITPFLSVLEQNAYEIRKVIGELGVLEHHSNVVKQTDDNDEKEAAMSNYLIESWDSQTILTSMVQFFQTLFKTKSANIRRFSSLANSVLILDEVQSLPIEVTTLFNLTMNFLNKVMNTTIILCTATQPAYDSTAIKHKLSYGGKYGEAADIAELTHDEKEVFSRTELRKFDENNQHSNLSDLVEFVLGNDESILAIFNTKKTVDKFYTLLKELTDRPIYQLSTNMCAQHRLDIISEIKQGLEDGLPLICISTQLIEAGVDVDFNHVIRSYAGIDSIVQASGRCNREGKRDKGQVTLVNLTNEEENILSLKEIKAKKDATEYILHKISSPIEMSLLNRDFFEYYYANNQGSMDYPLSHGESVYDYLSINSYQDRNNFKGKLKQAFKTAGLKMNLINNDTVGVLVPYGDAIEKLLVLEELCEYDYPSVEDYQIIKALLKELQPYTVNVRKHDQVLEATKSYLNGQIQILSDGYYDEKKGITLESGSFLM